MKRKSYFVKLLSFNIVLVIIAVSFLGYIAYYKTSSLMNEKIDKINAQLLLQSQIQLENSLQTVESAIIQFTLLPSFTSLLDDDLTMNSYDNYVKVKNMVSEVSSLYAHSSIINSLEIINLEKGWVLRNGGVLLINEVYTREEIDQFRKVVSRSKWSKSANSDFFQYTLKVPFSAIDRFQGIVRTKISSSDIFRELMPSKDLGQMTMIDDDGNIIRNITQYELRDQDVNHLVQMIQMQVNQTPQGNFLSKINGSQYSFIFRHSEKYKWTYISLISTLEAEQNSRFIGLFIFITGFVVVSVFFVLSFYGTRRLYSPIKRLYHMIAYNSSEKLNAQSQSNEMDYINNRMHAFFQDSQKLKVQLHIQTNQLNDFFAFKLFQGEVNPQEIESNFRRDACWNHFYVLTVQIDTLQDTGYKDSDRDLLLFAVKNMLGETASDLLVLNPVIMNHTQVVLLGADHQHVDAFKEELYLLSRSIQQVVNQYLRLQVSIGISRPFNQPVEASTAYGEATDALKSRFTQGREAILYASDFDSNESGNKGKYPGFMVKELIDAIKFGDAEQSKRTLHDVIAEICSGHYGYRYCSMFIFLLLMDLIKISHQSDEMFVSLFKEKPIFQKLDQLLQTSVQEMEAWIFEHVVQLIMVEMLARSESQQRNMIKTLIQIIHDEYHSELTLEACASRFHYNPNYLGQIFRKETGSSFSDYLSQYRLNIARRLLAETDDQIQEIAEKLRFSNSQNFIRYFKKMEGITPKQYRDKLVKFNG
ncbi:helix-turn-helix domain-containing protein [Paenibacillus aceris]|uniref:AraC-like DNA-binding protein n=1 Tax=Paenibacillus aceris TaxID=869555 RepID=A0ABS4HX25_9BACL|nr:helix-turn-helix domain-containing protein [Paenibacillus aceris]MBP1963183.1 AraC-like DNA-binding protein [Paenibacillus aceris]NHW38700.1 helix-turn-helix domain-containing protein [Paenibacillus aceris]